MPKLQNHNRSVNIEITHKGSGYRYITIQLISNNCQYSSYQPKSNMMEPSQECQNRNQSTQKGEKRSFPTPCTLRINYSYYTSESHTRQQTIKKRNCPFPKMPWRFTFSFPFTKSIYHTGKRENFISLSNSILLTKANRITTRAEENDGIQTLWNPPNDTQLERPTIV